MASCKQTFSEAGAEISMVILLMICEIKLRSRKGMMSFFPVKQQARNPSEKVDSLRACIFAPIRLFPQIVAVMN
jgi:hypothetical protein